jgi:hypothetical protein
MGVSESKIRVDKLINELLTLLNELIDKCHDIEIANSSNELLETLEILLYCTNCNDNIRNNYYEFHINKSINEIKSLLVKLNKKGQKNEDIINWLNYELIKIIF